jgi:sulfur-oxidizing protein SoxA
LTRPDMAIGTGSVGGKNELMRHAKRWLDGAAASAGIMLGACAFAAQGDRALQEIQKYRQILEEDNPAELAEMSGQDLWTTRRGPKAATLERCDLGLGPGRLEGAYAQLPRYFADTGKVQDVESRLVTCMQSLQGLAFEEATRGWYERDSDIEVLTTYVAARSKGYPIDVPATQSAEARMYEIGREIFWRRAGPLDFSCASCHSLDGRRIRLQEMPNFTDPASTRAAMVTWPAYRVSQSSVWTMERRLIDCFRQMRWPEPAYLSDVVIALQVYLQKEASEGVMQAPGIKR